MFDFLGPVSHSPEHRDQIYITFHSVNLLSSAAIWGEVRMISMFLSVIFLKTSLSGHFSKKKFLVLPYSK